MNRPACHRLAPWIAVDTEPSPSTGEATQPRWWSRAPDPDLPAISTRRAYSEVLLVYSAFFMTGIIAAVLLLANRYKDLLNNGSWALYGTQSVDIVAQIGLAVTVVLLLAERRGVSLRALGLTLPRRADGKFAAGKITRIAAWAMFALVVGGVVNAALQTGHLPTQKTNGAEAVFAVTDSVQAGVIEELVVLAFVVVTLRQARRPWWEVAVAALVLRGAYHIYYGPGVVGILLWAGLFYWIFLRFRSILPLMVCHAAWDGVGFLSQRWGGVAVVGVLLTVALWIAAPITWLTERGDRKRAVVQNLAVGFAVPPGWHPDPSGVNQWRWWDGYRWTEHVSGHVASG
jgi:Protein of unknown function (DUF2510)/Type II CAAX prenyl endopeptidase Rce1-like